MIDVHLRLQVKALSTVLVLCDLFGSKYYSIDDIYELISGSNNKLTRGMEINKEYLSDALKNEDLKGALREILNDFKN